MTTCGDCVHFRAGAGCLKLMLSNVRFECALAGTCAWFVDVDEVTA